MAFAYASPAAMTFAAIQRQEDALSVGRLT